jgi:hypothetical protein
MSEKYPDSRGDIFVIAGFMTIVAIVILLAIAFRPVSAAAFPYDVKVCADAGNRPGTNDPAYCPNEEGFACIPTQDGTRCIPFPAGSVCVPCPKLAPVRKSDRKPS